MDYKSSSSYFIFMSVEIESKKEKNRGYMGESVVVVSACDDNYMPYLSVLIESLIFNSNTLYNYEILLLEYGNSNTMKETIMSMVEEHDNFSISFVEIPEDVIDALNKCQIKRWTIEIYYSLLAPYILYDYKKIVFFDCDVVNLYDVGELYKINLQSNLVGVSRLCGRCCIVNNDFLTDATLNVEGKDDLLAENYFNNGVMLLNLEEFRKTYSLDYILQYISSQEFELLDQDCLNRLCCGRIMYVDAGWNWYPYTKKEFQNVIKLCPLKYREYFEKGFEKPKNIHYTIPVKPWLEPMGMYAEKNSLFWKYAINSPFYSLIVNQMENYKKDKERLFFKYESKTWDDFYDSIGEKKLYLFGYGNNGKKIYEELKDVYKFNGIIDNLVENNELHIDVMNCGELVRREKRLEDVVILISNNDYSPVLLMLEKLGFTNMYVYVCMQKYTYHMNVVDIKNALKVLNNLEDNISRKVYGELLNRRVEYNHNHSVKMGDFYEGKMYFYNDLVNIGNIKVCVCIGIYAKEKLGKLKEFMGGFCETYAFNRLYAEDLFLLNSLDKIDYILIDEQESVNILAEIKDIINKSNPILNINISRIGKDFWEVPLFISDKFPNKKMNIRHHSTGFLDTILYVE